MAERAMLEEELEDLNDQNAIVPIDKSPLAIEPVTWEDHWTN